MTKRLRKIKIYLSIYAYNDFENIHGYRPVYEYFEMNNM